MRNGALTNRILAEATSFIQVEYGISELQASWDGFVQTSDHYGQNYKSRKEVYAEFANALADYIKFIGESSPDKVGS